jgi:hypothetical protein
MLPSIHHASTEQTATVHPDPTLYASLELSRSTWLVTCLLSENDRMSKYSTPGSDGCARCSVCWTACGRGLSNGQGVR